MSRFRSVVIASVIVACGALALSYALRRGKGHTQTVEIDLKTIGLAAQSQTFNLASDVASLPEAVQEQLRPIANPGDDYQSTDLVRGKRLPFRRLILAGVSQKYSIVHFERGGIGHSFYVVIFDQSNGLATARWVSSDVERMSDLAELKSAIDAGKLSNQLGQATW